MKDNKYIFQKILNYIRKISGYVEGVDYEGFAKDEEKVFACAFALCQISELTQKISGEEKARHTNIPWPAIKTMRNHIIHNYENVDMQILFNAITQDLPKLAKDMEKII